MKNAKEPCDLKSCSFCKLCLVQWLPLIAEKRQTLQAKKNELIFSEGDKVTGIYFVYSGTVKVHKQWGEKELILRFAKHGDIFGHRGLGSEPIFPISATAVEHSVVCFIEIEFFLASLQVNQAYQQQLLMFFADELKLSEQKMRNLAHMPVKGRVAQALVHLNKKFGTTRNGFIDLPLSRQDLASYTGATYETVFRILSEFSETKLIKQEGKQIGISNEKGLSNLF